MEVASLARFSNARRLSLLGLKTEGRRGSHAPPFRPISATEMAPVTDSADNPKCVRLAIGRDDGGGGMRERGWQNMPRWGIGQRRVARLRVCFSAECLLWADVNLGLGLLIGLGLLFGLV
ncbi:hypothetical protein GOBAR_DD24073 [Gossypium barbadense]|nr:hypothetical protein GOBAR_DD24073 [Gossypium barbadense]